jgi:hypothetical protein
MSRTAPAALSAILFAALSGCSSPDPQRNQIAKETAERNALLTAAQEHPAFKGEGAATGNSLPPLPGVNAPSPKKATPDTNAPEHNHH